MSARWTTLSLLLLAFHFGARANLQAGEKTPKAGIEFFEAKIRPVLVAQCYECHSAKSSKVKGGLLLDTKAGMLTGGDTGPAIVPGKPSESMLIQTLRHQGEIKMPSKKVQLPDSVIQNFVEWIKMGAPDPREGAAAAKGYKTM